MYLDLSDRAINLFLKRFFSQMRQGITSSKVKNIQRAEQTKTMLGYKVEFRLE